MGMNTTIIPSSSSSKNSLVIIAESSYRTLQNDDAFTNGKNIAVDEFIDSNGTKNTVNTGDTTATYDAVTDSYVCSVAQLDFSSIASISGFTNGANAFDGSAVTYAQKTGDLNYNTMTIYATITLPGGSADIKRIKTKAYQQAVKGNTSAMTAYFQVYRAGAWETAFTIGTVSGTGSQSFTGTKDEIVDLTGVTQARVYYSGPSIDTYDLRLYYIEMFSDYETSVVVCDAGTITLTGDEEILSVFGDTTTPAGTSVTVDISDGTDTLSGMALGDEIDISTLSSGTLKLSFNLITTDVTATPDLFGYGVVVTR